jgi:hypothetical protein
MVPMRLARLARTASNAAKILAAAPLLAIGLLFGFIAPAAAGSAHFVGTPVYTVASGTITVTAKEAGLGDEPQIHVTLSGTALCENNGGNDPSAQNKSSFAISADEPVQNGKTVYSLSVTPAFTPACSPPMTVVVTSLVLTDVTNGIAVVPVAG